jgi:hypothetical protein
MDWILQSPVLIAAKAPKKATSAKVDGVREGSKMKVGRTVESAQRQDGERVYQIRG